MKLVKTLIGLSLFSAATVSADPVTSLTAGLFSFSNISANNVYNLDFLPQSDISVSALAVSTSESGGTSSITFSTTGTPTPSEYELLADFNVSYSGVDPVPGNYTQGFTVNVSESANGTIGSYIFNSTQVPNANLNNTWQYFATASDSFSIIGSNLFDYTDPSTNSSTFTMTFTADDANTTGFVPEPSSVGYYAIGFGALLVGAFRRYGVKSRRFD